MTLWCFAQGPMFVSVLQNELCVTAAIVLAVLNEEQSEFIRELVGPVSRFFTVSILIFLSS